MKKPSNYSSKKENKSEKGYSKDYSKQSFDKKKKTGSFSQDNSSKKEDKKYFSKTDSYKKSGDEGFSKTKKTFSSDKADFNKTDKKFTFKDEKPFSRKPKDEKSEGYQGKYKKTDKKSFSKDEKPAFKKTYGDSSESYSDKSKKSFGYGKSDYKKTDKKPFLKDEKPAFKKTYGDSENTKDSVKKSFNSEKGDFKKKERGSKDYTSKNTSDFKKKKEKTTSFKDKSVPTYNMKFYEKKNKKDVVEEKEEPTDTRLNKFIANAGICSRREADDLIAQGFVKVNGKVITEMGYQVKPSDKVSYKDKILKREKLVYILLNKPKNCITTTDDPEERHTVMEIVEDACEERVYPVGRLDRNTTGLLLLTNDGDLAKKLAHPSNNIKKIYQVGLDRPIQEADYLKIQNGVELEDGFIKPDALALLTPDTLGIELHSGKNRVVRRIFEHLGYSVEKLDRTMYAGLTKKDLPRGKWRFLNQKEVVLLKFSKIKKTPQR